MYVNPFWFGVLMTVVGLVVVFIIIAFINVKRQEANAEMTEDVWMDEGDFKRMLNEAVMEAMRQNMFGGSVEDEDSDDGKAV